MMWSTIRADIGSTCGREPDIDLPATETPVTDAVLDRLAALGKPALDAAVERAKAKSPEAHAKAWILRDMALYPGFRQLVRDFCRNT